MQLSVYNGLAEFETLLDLIIYIVLSDCNLAFMGVVSFVMIFTTMHELSHGITISA